MSIYSMYMHEYFILRVITKISTMSFSVIRMSKDIIRPLENTPSGTLELSVIDRLPGLRANIQSLHVFRHGYEAAKTISEALAKALVPYYPLAGRLTESSDGNLQIACSGEGVWFVEAHANCSLDAVNYFENITEVPHQDLLPDLPPQNCAIDPLVLMQVTRFTCEGFVIGILFSHSICDGVGAAQFLNAVGEFARGLSAPKIAPVWHREVLAPPKLEKASEKPKLPSPSPPPPMPELEHISFDIPLARINKLKYEFLELTGRHCSTFEVVAASIWSCRTRAINLDKDTNVNLVFYANARQLLDPPLPEGYYGNCFFPVTVTTSVGWLLEASNAEIVELIKDAKSRLPFEFNKWMKDQLNHVDEPFVSPFIYNTMFISEWGRLGFNEIDYGWGKPVNFLPILASSIMPIAIVGLPPTPKKGIRLMMWCVQQMHVQSLLDQTMNISGLSDGPC